MAPDDRETINRSVLAGGPIVMESPEILAPAVPYPPLYIYNHGNSPTIYKRQAGGRKQWEMTRIPHFRIRPWSSLSGHGETISLRQGCGLSFGLELGIVIGRRAYRVGREHAAEHIAGVVGLNDGFMGGIFSGYNTNTPERVCTVHVHATDTISKSADGMGGIGPWIVTVEELQHDHVERVGTQRLETMKEATHKSSCIYDLLLRSFLDGKCVDRAYSGAYLLDAEFLIACLSRFMTLETGTVIGLGSAGWDGIRSYLGEAPDASREIGVEIEKYGRLTQKITRRVQPGDLTDGAVVTRRRMSGLSHAPSPDEKAPKAFWQLWGNYKRADELENIPDWVGLCPYLYPKSVLRDDTSPLVIPPHATQVACTVQLAAVMGDGPLYDKPAREVMRNVAGVAVMMQLWDRSFVEKFRDMTDYEYRSGKLLGYLADGFCRMGKIVPLARAADLSDLRMTIRCSDGGRAETGTSEYRRGLDIMIEAICHGTTVFPGDVFSLGRAGAPLVLESDKRLPAGTTLTASIAGLREISVEIDDQRGSEEQYGNKDHFWAEYDK